MFAASIEEHKDKMNNKVETHTLACPFCNTTFSAKGKMPMEITCPRCRTLLNAKSPWSIQRGTRKRTAMK
jgi:phage FluMu protein Com